MDIFDVQILIGPQVRSFRQFIHALMVLYNAVFFRRDQTSVKKFDNLNNVFKRRASYHFKR